MDLLVHQSQSPFATNSISANYYIIPFLMHQVPSPLLTANLLRTPRLCLEVSIQFPAYAWTIHTLLLLHWHLPSSLELLPHLSVPLPSSICRQEWSHVLLQVPGKALQGCSACSNRKNHKGNPAALETKADKSRKNTVTKFCFMGTWDLLVPQAMTETGTE